MEVLLLQNVYLVTRIEPSLKLTPLEHTLVHPDGATTIAYGMRGLNRKGRWHYRYKVWNALRKVERFYHAAISRKVCYYGPFKGEFGHFLLHNLPFLMHLHHRGVAIHYCGMELHKPLLVDRHGRDIIARWYPLRDFFAEVPPSANETVPPPDVQAQIRAFHQEARRSGMPHLDISDNDLYWYAFRNWQLDGRQHKYPLKELYAAPGGERSCVIFPRRKGAATSPNNGAPWDYMEVARAVAPHFDRVYMVGHPSLSADVTSEGNIHVAITADNAEILRCCAQASLIITQHSGAVHLGGWVNTPVLLIYNGMPPIKGLIDTLRFRVNISDMPLNYAFSLPEIVNFVATLNRG